MLRSLSASLLWRGLLAVAIGIIAILWPGVTIAAVVVIFAVAVFVDTVHQGSRAFSSEKAGPVAGHLLLALLDIAAGDVAIAWPGITALALTIWIGAWAVVSGIGEFAMAFASHEAPGQRSFLGFGGAGSCWQGWRPSGEPRAVVVIVHGIGERAGRYGHVAARLNAAGFAAYALDHRGHGRSSGPRGLIDRMDNAVEDVDSLVSLAATRHAGRPLHLLGHSMGGAIAITYALRHQERLRGLLLSSAAASLGSARSSTRLEAKALAAVAPTAGIMEIDPSLVSHDPAVVRAYREDPLVYQGKLPARTVAEVAAAIEGFAAGVP